MADFSHLKALEVSVDDTSRYVIHQITVNGLTPTLIVAPATDANKPYFNALIKQAGKATRAVKAGAINAGMIDENRAEDRELYPRHIIKGWENMIDANGENVAYSVEEGESFLSQLPSWVFDDLRNFCKEPANFVELMDLEIIAGN